MTLSHLPAPHLYRSGSSEPALRWGLVGPGWIAGEFVDAAHRHTQQRFTAVASRSPERGAAFAAAHGIEHVVGSIVELAARDDVDAIYVATPQSDHLASGLSAIAAGKHVLIEKPIALNANEAQQLVDAGRAAGVLVMEAMWSRYLPQTSVLTQLLHDGVLGEIRALHADHGQRIDADPSHRLYRPELGGGALLDLGIYPVQFASLFLGTPQSVTAVGTMTDTGVDAQSTLVLEHSGGAQATLTTTLLARTPTGAAVAGSEATITVDPYFYTPTTFTLAGAAHDSTALHWSDESGLRGFEALSWEATAFASFVGDGRIESPVHGHDETVAILHTIDQALAQLPAPAVTV
ncbi:Gfo/Idh/MocA family protein [Curtobacterium sp. NPDC089689]|uniref:Gfo/Idh/MocA family protein n=1 Tax=Curtobacterium sp. NPDC089689 TaxID=3363968 RepID=UPI00381C6811